MLTAASTTRAPDASITAPVMVPLGVCAKAAPAADMAMTTAMTSDCRISPIYREV
jgi:hypothetical protein